MSDRKDKLKKAKKIEWKTFFWYVLLLFMLGSVLATYLKDGAKISKVSYTEFLNLVDKGSISKVSIHPNDQIISGETSDGKFFQTYFMKYPDLIPKLRHENIDVSVDPSKKDWLLGIVVQTVLSFGLILLLWLFIVKQAQGAGNQALSFGKTRATPFKKNDEDTVKFSDVAGIDEVKIELEEIVDFLKMPDKYRNMGASIPKGVLLMGPPGTGKTLLAKAVAGEADVPFYSLSGSDFVEMFVGVGASRVRDLFSQAKNNQPSLIFIDEIDAVGRHRGAGLGGGHDEREQTLNQMLVEMDGFNSKSTVIVIAATNRADILDPALLRPGRFDRQVVVDKPDILGRGAILKIHAKGKKISDAIDLSLVAQQTPGFTGADLANLMNEAALLAARANDDVVSQSHLEEAIERILAGPERESKIMTDKEKEIIVYHELGHAIVAAQTPLSDKVHKISILPRGQALGYTLQFPDKDKYLISREEMKSKIKTLMGGRIAEEIIMGDVTSGASNDIERATELARSYVCVYGMSSRLGVRKYGGSKNQVFLGKAYTDHTKDYSDFTAREIDVDVRLLIEECYNSAFIILKQHKPVMEALAVTLKEKEVLNSEEFYKLFHELREKFGISDKSSTELL